VSAKRVIVALGLAFAATLAIVVGKQMSTEAMAVVIGVVCGVAASIPTSVVLLVVLTRRERQGGDERRRGLPQGASPPVVVIQGGTPQALPQGMQAGYWPPPMQGAPVERQFYVVGGDDLIVDDRAYR